MVRLRAPLAASQVTTSVTANGSHAFHSHYITTRAAFRMPDKIIMTTACLASTAMHPPGPSYTLSPQALPSTLARSCTAKLSSLPRWGWKSAQFQPKTEHAWNVMTVMAQHVQLWSRSFWTQWKARTPALCPPGRGTPHPPAPPWELWWGMQYPDPWPRLW